MSSRNLIYKVKMKESITFIVRQMSCEKKNSFNNRPSTDNPDLDQVIFISSQPVSNQT